MPSQERRNNGTFAPKSNEIRQVRSVRLTDRAWDYLGEIAISQGLTRGDLLEKLAENTSLGSIPSNHPEQLFCLSLKDYENWSLSKKQVFSRLHHD